MSDISRNLALEIADNWDQLAATQTEAPAARRATLRECADVIRMLADRAEPINDGGWSTVERWSGSKLKRLSVPGTSVSGMQSIEVEFAEGPIIHVESDSIAGAWQALNREILSRWPPAPPESPTPFGDAIHLLEQHWYTPAELAQWLLLPHTQLSGRTALEALAAGDAGKILALVRRMDEGVYL